MRVRPFQCVQASLPVALLCALTSCGGGGDGPTPPPPVTPVISLTTSSIELAGLGSTATVNATVSPTGTAISWRSESPSVATISGAGPSAVVTAIAAGTTTIVAEAVVGSQRAEARATVTVRPVVRRVDVTPATAALRVGQVQNFAATLTADAGADVRVVWRSVDAARVTIDSLGRATALTPGSTLVIASSAGTPTVADTASIVVSAAPRVRSVVVQPTRDTLLVNAARTYTATVDADSGLTRAVSWVTSAPAVATVDASGRVSAVAPGNATISAIAVADTSQRASMSLVVRTPSVFSVRAVASRTSLVIPDTARVSAVVTADPGVSTSVLFQSLTPTVASVSGTGLVSAIGPGLAWIRVSTVAAPFLSDSVALTVTAPPVPTQWTDSYDARIGDTQMLSEIAAMAVHAPTNTLYAVGGLTQGRIYEESAAGQWRTLTVAAGPPLRAVDATAAGVWAVGDGGRILKLTGSAWNEEASGTTRNLTQLSMRDDGSGIAVGAGALMLERRNNVWTTINDSASGGANLRRLGSVKAAPAGRVVYTTWRREAPFAGTDMLRFDGTAWSALAASDPGRNGAFSITVTGAGDVVVTGADNDAFQWYVARLNGAGWIREYTSNSPTSANSGIGRRCADGSMLITTATGEVFLRSGGAPTNPFLDTRTRFSGGTLVCRSATDWTVHRYSGNAGGGLWRVTPSDIRFAAYLSMLTGVSVGNASNIWATNTTFGRTAIRFDGVRWIPEVVRVGSTIGNPTAIAATGGSTAYIATGTLFGTWSPSGYSWSAAPGFMNDLWAGAPLSLWGAMSNNSFDNRRGLQRWGGSWGNANVPTGATTWNFTAVHGVPGTSVVMAVAGSPVNRAILRAVGSGFAVDTVSVNGNESLSRIAVTSANDAVVVGFQGSARWNGTAWTPLAVLSSSFFTAITGRPGEYYAFTEDRGIHALIGTRWIRIGTSAEVVRDASMVNETAIAVGDNGYIAYGRPSATARRPHTRVRGTPSDMRPR